MATKIPRSISFFMTSAAFTSSFSESSLTVMPSEIVISRLIGGGPCTTFRRCGRRTFSSSIRSRGWRTGGAVEAGTSARRVDRGRSESGLHAAAGSGMLRARSAGPRRTGGRAGTHAGLGDQRLAGTDRSAIDRLAGNRRGRRFRNSGTRADGRGRHGRARRAQLLGKIGTRRNYRSRHRLAGERPRCCCVPGAWRLHRTAVLLWRLRRTLRQRSAAASAARRCRGRARAFGGAGGRAAAVRRESDRAAAERPWRRESVSATGGAGRPGAITAAGGCCAGVCGAAGVGLRRRGGGRRLRRGRRRRRRARADLPAAERRRSADESGFPRERRADRRRGRRVDLGGLFRRGLRRRLRPRRGAGPAGGSGFTAGTAGAAGRRFRFVRARRTACAMVRGEPSPFADRRASSSETGKP